MLANTHQSRLEQLNGFRNKALLSALDALLKLADPDCDDVKIQPMATDPAPEHKWRQEQAAYLKSWAIGPLTDALRQERLLDYAEAVTPTAAQYMNELDNLSS